MNLMQAFQSFYSKEIESYLPDDVFSEVYRYALFPTGKLFRPELFLTLCQDLNLELSEREYFIAMALEVHHTYTLIHDDLPCMDNDDMRRGRASTHKKFNEWQALLAADGLLNLSYQLLAKANDIKLIQIFSDLTGPQGLIQGQALDLSKSKKSFQDYLYMHELKTARLMQACTMISAHLTKQNLNDFSKLGKTIGMIFQLLDDKDDQNEEENIFKNYAKEAHEYLDKMMSEMKVLLDKYQLKRTQEFLEKYYLK